MSGPLQEAECSKSRRQKLKIARHATPPLALQAYSPSVPPIGNTDHDGGCVGRDRRLAQRQDVSVGERGTGHRGAEPGGLARFTSAPARLPVGGAPLSGRTEGGAKGRRASKHAHNHNELQANASPKARPGVVPFARRRRIVQYDAGSSGDHREIECSLSPRSLSGSSFNR